MWVQSLGQEDPLEKEVATHSSSLAQRISWTTAHQVPLSMDFSRQEYWSGLPFLSPCIFFFFNLRNGDLGFILSFIFIYLLGCVKS